VSIPTELVALLELDGARMGDAVIDFEEFDANLDFVDNFFPDKACLRSAAPAPPGVLEMVGPSSAAVIDTSDKSSVRTGPRTRGGRVWELTPTEAEEEERRERARDRLYRGEGRGKRARQNSAETRICLLTLEDTRKRTLRAQESDERRNKRALRRSGRNAAAE
jgi:hypothetical protein